MPGGRPAGGPLRPVSSGGSLSTLPAAPNRRSHRIGDRQRPHGCPRPLDNFPSVGIINAKRYLMLSPGGKIVVRTETGVDEYCLRWSIKEYQKARVRYFTPEWDRWRAANLS